MKFNKLYGTVMNMPVVEMESPFFLTFDVKVANDVVPAVFIGNFARALRGSIRTGDEIIMRDGLIDDGKLVFDFIHMKPNTKLGRNINIMA